MTTDDVAFLPPSNHAAARSMTSDDATAAAAREDIRVDHTLSTPSGNSADEPVAAADEASPSIRIFPGIVVAAVDEDAMTSTPVKDVAGAATGAQENAREDTCSRPGVVHAASVLVMPSGDAAAEHAAQENVVRADDTSLPSDVRADAPAAAAADKAAPSISAPAEVDVSAVETILGYQFSDKALVEEALTHRSFTKNGGEAGTYERLEFLGDGVINCLVARHVFREHRSLQPGPLTRLREVNVDKEKLARAAVAHDLHRFLRHNEAKIHDQVDNFTAEVREYDVHSNGQVNTPKVLCDIVESLMGAVYVDSNYDLELVWQVFRRLADPLIGPEEMGKHPMSELTEMLQSMSQKMEIKTDDWTKSLTVEVVVDGETVGSATYDKNEKVARNRAVKSALDTLKARKMVSRGALSASAPVVGWSTRNNGHK